MDAAKYVAAKLSKPAEATWFGRNPEQTLAWSPLCPECNKPSPNDRTFRLDVEEVLECAHCGHVFIAVIRGVVVDA